MYGPYMARMWPRHAQMPTYDPHMGLYVAHISPMYGPYMVQNLRLDFPHWWLGMV